MHTAPKRRKVSLVRRIAHPQLHTFSEDTAFLENVDELQRYFGVTFHDNPLVSKSGRYEEIITYPIA